MCFSNLLGVWSPAARSSSILWHHLDFAVWMFWPHLSLVSPIHHVFVHQHEVLARSLAAARPHLSLELTLTCLFDSQEMSKPPVCINCGMVLDIPVVR